MKIVCAWCKKELGEKEPLEDKSVTHTICPECAKKMDLKPTQNVMQDNIVCSETTPKKTYREIMYEIITKYSKRTTADIDEMFYGNAPDQIQRRLRYAIFVARKHNLPEVKILESFANKHYPWLLERMKEDAEEPDEDDDDNDLSMESQNVMLREPEILQQYPNDKVPKHIDDITKVPETPMPVLRGMEGIVKRTSPKLDALVEHLGYTPSDTCDSCMTDVQLIEDSQKRLAEVSVIPEDRLSGTQKIHLKLARTIGSEISPSVSKIQAAVIPPASDRVRTAGLYGRSAREIYISCDQLNRGQSTVDTAIHELAHDTSGEEDGEEGHKLEMEAISSSVVKKVKNGEYDGMIRSVDFAW